jgi:hypothetical protein
VAGAFSRVKSGPTVDGSEFRVTAYYLTCSFDMRWMWRHGEDWMAPGYAGGHVQSFEHIDSDNISVFKLGQRVNHHKWYQIM